MTNQVKIDKDKCLGCGTCVGLCPACFKLGEDGKAEVAKNDCEGGEGCVLKEVAESCPAGAITIKN